MIYAILSYNVIQYKLNDWIIFDNLKYFKNDINKYFTIKKYFKNDIKKYSII